MEGEGAQQQTHPQPSASEAPNGVYLDGVIKNVCMLVMHARYVQLAHRLTPETNFPTSLQS